MELAKNRLTTLDSAPMCLKVPEVAAVLGVSRAHAYQLVNSNGFPRLVIGKRFVIPKDALVEWIRANTQTGEKGCDQNAYR